ncbi:MAG: hypothetical protein RR998_06415 [Oscillospiraceae bacterium]
MTKQKNKFLTFLFSVIPGCGQMFMGFMRRGMSLGGLFGLGIAFASFFNIDEFAFVSIIIWFYAFFDSLNLMSCDPEKFSLLEDDFLILGQNSIIDRTKLASVKFYRIMGALLVACGAYAIWSSFTSYFYNNYSDMYPAITHIAYTLNHYLPRIAVSAVIIYIGIRLIKHKKAETAEETLTVTDNEK